MLGVGTIGNDVAVLDLLTRLNEGLLVNAGTGVRTHELTKRIDEDSFVRSRAN